MEDQHLTPAWLRRFLDRDRGEEETLLLLHLLALCPVCNASGGHVLDLYRAGAIDLAFCSIDVELALSRAVAPALFEKLKALSFEEQADLIRETEEFQSVGFLEFLCQESERIAATDAMRAVDLAELAVLAASLLKEGPIEDSWLDQVRGHAFAHLGNALRVLGELRSAADAFRQADEHWETGTDAAGDSLGYEAHYLALKASLRREERRFEEALALLDQALAAEGGPALRGAILVAQAKTYEEMGDLLRAISLLREAAFGLDPHAHASPRLLLCIEHNLLLLLTAEGRYREAEDLLPTVRELSETLGNRLDLLRLRWAEARIAAAAGTAASALALFEEVRAGLLAQEIGFDAALVSLELAVLHLKRGGTADVKRIAREIMPVFQSRDIHREALVALAIFIRATDTETVTLALADRVVDYLRKARYDPDLRFNG